MDNAIIDVEVIEDKPLKKKYDPTVNLLKHRKPKQKGATSHKSRIVENMSLTTIKKFGDWMQNEGVERFKEEMQKLEGKDYVIAYTTILEYFVPKLSRRIHDISDDLKVDQISFE